MPLFVKFIGVLKGFYELKSISGRIMPLSVFILESINGKIGFHTYELRNNLYKTPNKLITNYE